MFSEKILSCKTTHFNFSIFLTIYVIIMYCKHVSEQQKVVWRLPGTGIEGKRELVFIGCRVSAWRDEKFPEMNGKNSSNSMNARSVVEVHTYK